MILASTTAETHRYGPWADRPRIDPRRKFSWLQHTMAYNVAGWPAAVVRCGESAEGLPITVQVAAGPWREDIVLAVAAALEQGFGSWKASEIL